MNSMEAVVGVGIRLGKMYGKRDASKRIETEGVVDFFNHTRKYIMSQEALDHLVLEWSLSGMGVEEKVILHTNPKTDGLSMQTARGRLESESSGGGSAGKNKKERVKIKQKEIRGENNRKDGNCGSGPSQRKDGPCKGDRVQQVLDEGKRSEDSNSGAKHTVTKVNSEPQAILRKKVVNELDFEILHSDVVSHICISHVFLHGCSLSSGRMRFNMELMSDEMLQIKLLLTMDKKKAVGVSMDTRDLSRASSSIPTSNSSEFGSVIGGGSDFPPPGTSDSRESASIICNSQVQHFFGRPVLEPKSAWHYILYGTCKCIKLTLYSSALWNIQGNYYYYKTNTLLFYSMEYPG